MRRIAGVALAVLVAVPWTSAAHQLDEYVQATRITIARDRISVTLDLTPGAAVASAVVDRIDGDRNGLITASEAHAYGRRVLGDLLFVLDGVPLPLSLIEISVPAIADMRDGVAAIRIEASADASSRAGQHEVLYRNNHERDISAYLVNAMMPDSASISIERQYRDQQQREFRLAYEVSGNGVIVWTMTAVLLVGGLVYGRRGAILG